MKKKWNLFLLIFLVGYVKSEETFEFTAQLYNLSVEENSVGTKYARCDNVTKIGVKLPEKDSTCKFRVAEVVGEKSSLFKAHARQVGDFVFLRIRYKGDNPLNRELKEFYDMLVKATCKRRDSSNLETTSRVHLRVIDRNDASPMFMGDEDGYEATVEDTIEPFSKVLQVEASDADIGINSAIYFSMLNRSHDFFIEPVTGWIRTLRPLKAGKYEMKVKSEDRASRLFYHDENEVQPSWTADVTINVIETTRQMMKIAVEKKKIQYAPRRQLAAIITLKDVPDNQKSNVQVEIDERQNMWFDIVKENGEDEWKLFTISHVPEGANVTVVAGFDYQKSETPPTITNVTAVVRIEHVVEHSISLPVKKLKFAVEELAPMGKFIAKIEADIGNPDDKNLVRFELKSANSSQKLPFSIGEQNGLIRVKTTNFAERMYDFEVIARIHGIAESGARVAVNLEVLDSNNHAPQWAVKWLRQAPIVIANVTKIGDVLIKVDAQDRDDGDNGRIIYKLASERDIPMRIDAESGEIVVSDVIRRDENLWNVAVWAVDWGSPMSRSSALNLVFYRNGTKTPPKPKPIVIQEGENKQAPIFESFPDVLEVSEDAPIGTIIAKIRASDEDTGYNGFVRYVILDPVDKSINDQVLTINETSGIVAIASNLTNLMRYGAQFAEVSLKVRAEDAGSPRKFAEKLLKLRVLDVNNHAPQFDQPWYTVRVTEDAPIGKEIIKVTAIDADGGNNSKIKYSVTSSFKDADNIVTIDGKTGIVRLAKKLDRETQDVIAVTLMATDHGESTTISTFVNLTIYVDDVNDNAPQCLERVTRTRIPEDYPHGAFVTCLVAADLDLGANARIRFTFDATHDATVKSPFRIDHHTGCVFVHSPDVPLDFHRKSFYNLTIDVGDNGEQILSTSCELHIELIDIAQNHLAIEFDDVAKEASVYENSPAGTEVIMIEAKEIADEKRKIENVKYSIIDGDGRPYFSIDDKGLVRTAIALDREFKSAHWLTVEARDGAIDNGKMRGGDESSRRRAIVHVFVRVLDRNDHRPQPRQPVYFASVRENSEANVVIVKVEANDLDEVGNDAAPPLQYRIDRGDPQSFFRIDLTSGYMTTSGSRKLDREKQAEHELWVSICDGGEPQLCSQVAVIVAVDDENDNAPQFTQPIHHYNVRAKFAGELCRIFAVDMDDGLNAHIFYNVTEGDGRFSINENGIISTSQPIHGDESYALTVQATDRGSPPQFAATRVVLTAVGERVAKAGNRAPQIAGKKSDYVIPISDADQVGLTIGKLEATDEDGDDMWWNITGGDNHYTFDVKRDNGQLLLANKVDNLPRGELRLNISCTDGHGASDQTTVIIQVARSASHRPKFSASHYQTEISEKTAVGTQIYTLKATGEDIGPGTKPLVFSIFSIEDVSMEEKIRVEPSSGNVIVMESLDFETSRQIKAVVQVRQANLKNFATLIVNINDENDNAPRFSQSNQIAFVDESDPIGSLVARVTAFDADSNENGMLQYSMISGNEQNLFELDKISGEVRLVKKIDRDEHTESILRIRASDTAAKYSLSDEMTLHVKNSNATIDSRVRFHRKTHQIVVNDAAPPGTPLVVLAAQHHGSVRYQVRPPCPYFEVHPLSGAAILTKWLTKERSATKSVNCTVTAETGDGQMDETRIVLKIRRTNQHSPLFRQQIYRAQIRENSPIGNPVLLADNSPLIVSATDADIGPSGLVAYRMMDDDYFVVDLISGAIRVRKPIDFEKIKEWRFHVNAYDMGSPPQSSLMPALVIVTVIDENDEPPKFGEKSMTSMPIYLPTANNIIILPLQEVRDVDTVGRLRYVVKDDEAKKVFSINSISGQISVADADGLKEKNYTFDVLASDGLHSDTYTLTVPVVQPPASSAFRFTQPKYVTSILENTSYPVGKTLLSVTTIGLRDNVGVIYSIINQRDEFVVHSGTGAITATGIVVDREVEPVIRLVIQARSIEKVQHIAQATIDIHVEDLNDETPRFVNLPYDVAVSMDSKIGDEVMTMKAVDKDEGLNSKLSYSSTKCPPQFVLMANGKLQVAQKLETLEIYTFDVIVEDHGNPKLKSTTMITLRVVDKAQPVFDQQVYTITISPESVKKGDAIVTVRAKSNVNLDDGIVGYEIVDEKKKKNEEFDIDWQSGVIRLACDPKKLVGNSMLSLEVEAVEATKPRLRSRAQVVINVKSNKIEAPVFEKSSYSNHVSESTAIGERVLEISAKQADSFAISGEDSSAFSIDSDTGEIRLAKLLDFEAKQMYKFVATASDRRQLQTSVDVTLIVDDVNDETPRFMNSFSSAEINDGASPGQFVTILSVTDLDTVSSLPDNTLKLLYKIVDGDVTLFDIDSATGQVTLARLIEEDDVMEKRKTVNVSVTDGIFTSYAQLLVDVRKSGTRQLPPRFEQSQYVASALENTPVNKSVLIRVTARDGISPIHYSLGPASSSAGSKGAWPVRIDKTSGRIHVSRVLNYHNDKIYQIPLVAEDSVGRRTFATLTLSVIDINDKPPVFVLSSYSCSISETAKEGDTVLMVSATDDDDEADSIEYSLLEDSPNALFSVHPKQGTVTVVKKLQNKAGQTFSLIVKATDSANPPHHATTTVEINVAADGTAVPRLSNSHYLFSVAEDATIGSVIGRVQQVNPDVGEVRFTIAGAQDTLPFSIERSTGKIIVKTELDRERKAEWRMAIKAEAAGAVHAITTVTVDVADVNDNAPAFQGNYERLTISEDSPIGTSVAIFSATDRDEAPSGTIRFSLVDDDKSHFALNPESGWLTVSSSLDRERQEKYDLIARATDEGGLKADLKFSIHLNDVNDSPPRFSKPRYEVDLDPTETQFVVDIIVNDADLPPNNLSKIFISSGNEEGIFEINETNRITVKRPELFGLSREKSQYILELTAFDGVFATTAEVVVRIKNEPETHCEVAVQTVRLNENSKKGSIVVKESVNSKMFTFAIKEERHPFVINFRNGIIKVKEEIDFETDEMIEITRVTLNKKKEPVCEETIVVEIVDENDNRPKILSPKVQNVTIKENLVATVDDRRLLTRILATDADQCSALEFRIKNTFEDTFAIDTKSGVLTAIKSLDRESVGEYRIDVVVSDGKFEDQALVNVIVADQNDNVPVFDRKVYSMKVMESESIGYELVKVRADGGDVGETVTYTLKPSASTKISKLVRLDAKTGVLTLAENLDFETLQRDVLVVVARDSGTPPLTAEATIEIDVMDENDNVPVFRNLTYSAKIAENSENGTKVLTVEADDKDSEHFGRVVYSLKRNETSVPFVISQDGVISVNGRLDYEKEQSRKYRLRVEAKDGGGLKSEVDVDIEVEDVNDNPPIFEDCNMTAVIQESANINSVVLTMSVSDLDGPNNAGPFKFEIKGDGAKSFKINGLNLMTASRLQHSKKNRYLLTVVAKDVRGKSTDCPLTIWVKEESRHAPEMAPLRIRVNALQTEIDAGTIGRLRASDADSEDLLRFSIVDDSIRGPLPTVDTPRPSGKLHTFRVDANSGYIWSDHSIPAGLHSFNVTVTDGKFKTVSYVEVLVSSIDSDTIEHSVAIRIRSMNIDEFMTRFETKFRTVIGAHLNINADNVQLISVQEVEPDGRGKRSIDKDLEILFTSQRGPGRGFLKPDHVYSRLKLDFQNIQDKSDGMRYQLITEMCTPGVCRKGECRERIELLEDRWTRTTSENVGFVSPYHRRDAQCLCPDGLGGKRCEKEMNECSRSPCESYQLCIPSKSFSQTFECVCPLGMEGDRCDRPSCNNDGKCLEEAELSVGGDGYFEMSLSNEIESRMELEIEIRTSSTNGVVMWSGATHDYHMLAISDGMIQYSWDAGSGQGLVRSQIRVADGKWHRIGISRRQRRTRLIVDDSDVQEAFSPVGSTVINLHRYSQKLVFGAKVEENEMDDEALRITISQGVAACFRTISVDGRKVPKTRQGLRLFGAAPGCLALTSSPCSEMPCLNDGSCVASGKSFECVCPMRYSGDRCQIDLEPCSSSPCPTGIQCIPYHNEYLCKCPNGFTGKHCESRGFDEFEPSCNGEKCGTGQCISIPRQNPRSSDFICNCTGGILQSTPCQQNSSFAFIEILLKFEIIIIIVGILLILLLIAICVFVICRCCKKSSDPKYGAHCDVPHMRNTRVLMPVVDPPPLPPRGFRQIDGFTNNTTNNTNRPMVQVRPFSNDPVSRHDSRSPSVCGSSKGARRELTDFGVANRARQSDRRAFNDASLTNLRSAEAPLDDWRTSLDENINAAIRSGVEGRLVVGTTELTPVVNDDDYMTMKPRRRNSFDEAKSKIPEIPPPRVPAHAAPPPSLLHSSRGAEAEAMAKSVLYDDPISMDSQSCTIDDIDNDSDIEEVRIHIS